MSTGIILKIFADCCLFFAILGAFPGVFCHSYALLLPALLCACGVGLAAWADRMGKNGLCRLCILIPACSLLLAEGGQEMWILLPVIVYTAAVILRGHFSLEYYSYRYVFEKSLILLGALYLLLCTFSFLEGVAEERTVYPAETLRYGLVYLLTGIILQRQLRLGQENQAQGSKTQMAAVLGSTAAVILGFLAVEPALRKGATAVFKAVLSVVLGGILAVFDKFSDALDTVEIEAMNAQVQAQRGDSVTHGMGAVIRQIQRVTEAGTESPSYWWVWLVVILVLIAMVLVLRSFRKQETQIVSRETVGTVDTPAEKKESRRTNRGRVRHYYREYLRMEKKRGLRLRSYDTTEDILRRVSADTNEEAAARLRQLYLRARYDEKSQITREQADAAKAALKKCRSGNAEA